MTAGKGSHLEPTNRKLEDLTPVERAHIEICHCGHIRTVHTQEGCLYGKCKCEGFRLKRVDKRGIKYL